MEALPADIEGLYRELHRIDEETRQHGTKLTDVEARTVPKEAVTNLRGDLDRLTAELGSLSPAIDDVRRDFDATIAGLRRDIDATIGGLRQDLVGLAGEAASIRTQAGEAAAPLQSAVAGLRRDLEAVRQAASAAEADDVLAFEGLKDLDGRLRAVETLPERVEKVFRELSRASGDAITHQQGLLHEAVGQLHAVESRAGGRRVAARRPRGAVRSPLPGGRVGQGAREREDPEPGPDGLARQARRQRSAAGDLVERAGRKLAGGDHGVAVQPVGDGLALGPPGKDHRRRRSRRSRDLQSKATPGVSGRASSTPVASVHRITRRPSGEMSPPVTYPGVPSWRVGDAGEGGGPGRRLVDRRGDVLGDDVDVAGGGVHHQRLGVVGPVLVAQADGLGGCRLARSPPAGRPASARAPGRSPACPGP